MKFIRASKISIFRKAALALWNSGGDPTVYGLLEVDVTDLDLSSSPTPLVIKAMAEVMGTHKELNSILRWGRLYYRQSIDISVLVNIVEEDRNDLSFATLENVDQMSLSEVHKILYKSSHLIRKKQDPKLGFALNLIHRLPWFMTRIFLNLFSFLTHDMNMNLSALRLPRTPFGPVMITNIGSLGIQKALVPLVPMAKTVLMMSVGEITKEARVINDQIEIRKIIHLGITFDHRFFDGSHAAKMIRHFQESFKRLAVEASGLKRSQD